MNTRAIDVSRSAEHSKGRRLFVGAVAVEPRSFAAGGHEVEVEEAWVERGTLVWERLVAEWEASKSERSTVTDWLTRPHPPEDARPAPPFVLAFKSSSATLVADEFAAALLVWGGAPGQGTPVRVEHVYSEPLPSPLPAEVGAHVQKELGADAQAVLRFALPMVRAGAV